MINDESKRIIWLDIFKAICIIMMVMGHAGAPFTTIIYMFHMPAFIFAAGYTYSGDKYSLGKYLKKKLVTIICPMFLINIIYIIIFVLAQNTGVFPLISAGEPQSLVERLKLLIQYLGFSEFGGATWFLMVLFTIEILYWYIHKISLLIKKEWLMFILAVLLSLMGWEIVKQQLPIPVILQSYLFDLSLYGLIYYAMGHATRKWNVFEYIENKTMLILSISIVLFFGCFYYKGVIPMNWPTRQFDKYFIHIITCISMFYICVRMAKMLEKTGFSKPMEWIGQHTFSILILHFLSFKLVFALLIILDVFPLSYLKNLTPLYSPYPVWLFVTIASIAICLGISYLGEKNPIANYIVNGKGKINHVNREGKV